MTRPGEGRAPLFGLYALPGHQEPPGALPTRLTSFLSRLVWLGWPLWVLRVGPGGPRPRSCSGLWPWHSGCGPQTWGAGAARRAGRRPGAGLFWAPRGQAGLRVRSSILHDLGRGHSWPLPGGAPGSRARPLCVLGPCAPGMPYGPAPIPATASSCLSTSALLSAGHHLLQKALRGFYPFFFTKLWFF